MNKDKTKSMSSLKLDVAVPETLKPRIIIFGVGGAGGNAINNMIRSNLEGVEFVAANTDSQSLQNSLAEHKIQLGVKTTKGLGAGSFPDRGKAAAEENIEEIDQYLEGVNMVFIAAGMGGGTGTGAAPVISKLARERDILTVGVVTKPFHFEGKYRMETAESGIEELKKYVDTLIIIPNQNLFRIANENTTFESAFKMADDVLHAGVRGVTDLITMPGLVNLDFADIRTIMTKMGKAMMGTGEAEGENRAVAACEAAISNPLLDDISIKGANGVLVNMTGGPDMTLFEADMAVNAIKKEVDPNANIIFGSAFNENMKGKIRISVVATGIDSDEFSRGNIKISNKEPSRFEINSEDNNSSSQSFFDPGISAKIEDDIAKEATDLNSKDLKGDKKEKIEKKEEIKTEEKVENKKNNNQQQSFFSEDNSKKEEKKEEESKTQKTIKKEILSKQESAPIIEERNDNAPKIEASSKKEESNKGFSLFGFMNNIAKSDNKEVKEIKNDNNKKKDSSDIDTSKLSDLETKRQKFFNATIFDDDLEGSNDKIDDDILNVPAFFRRKKK